MKLLFWISIFMIGTGVVMEAMGHHLSFSNSPTSELTTRIQSLPILEKEQSNIEIPKPSSTVVVIPKVIKASDKSLRSATYIFESINGEQRTEFINKFSNGKNDLVLATNNLALVFDSKPELLASVEKLVSHDMVNIKSEEELEFHKKEYQRLKELNDSLSKSLNNNSYIDRTQNTDRSTGTVSNPQWNGSSNNKQPQPLIPPQNLYKETVRYDVIGDSVYGSDGSRYDRIGDSIYKNDGTRYDVIGDSIYGNDGSRYDQIGDSTYKNDGTRYDAIGDTVYGSDGSRYYTIGDSIYAEPGN